MINCLLELISELFTNNIYYLADETRRKGRHGLLELLERGCAEAKEAPAACVRQRESIDYQFIKLSKIKVFQGLINNRLYEEVAEVSAAFFCSSAFSATRAFSIVHLLISWSPTITFGASPHFSKQKVAWISTVSVRP